MAAAVGGGDLHAEMGLGIEMMRFLAAEDGNIDTAAGGT